MSGSVRFEELLPVELRAPLLARSVLHRHLCGRLPGERLDDAKLLTSELITRAILHASYRDPGWIALTIDLREERIRVEIRDDWYRTRSKRHRGEGDGWGILLVEQLASRWGIAPGPPSWVWFEMEVGDGDMLPDDG
jgi:anti-sigma regulatory factor (Ser/Thr protein kinase)